MRMSLRLILSLVAAVTLVSVAFALYQVRAEDRSRRNDLEKRAQVLAESLQETIQPLLAKGAEENLQRIVERFGNRGYRTAQLEASVIGGKLYLAAYAQRLGASGLTFFDDEVTEFFSPHATGKSVMFLLALGRSVKRKL